MSSLRLPRLEFPALPRVLLGPGTWLETPDIALTLGVRHFLLVTTGVWDGDVFSELEGVLRKAGVAVTHCSHGSSNTKDRDIDEAYRLFLESGCDAVLSFGGGSAHDTTKGVRVLSANHGTSINDYTGRNPLRMPATIPHVAINTTSGTGAEVSSSFVYTDTRNKLAPRKRFVIDRLAVPTVAVNDPILMSSQPRWLVTFAGIDALTHAIEAFTAAPQHAVAQRQAAFAAQLICANLESAVVDANNASAIEALCLGQYLAGCAFSAAGLGLVHAVSHALSAHFDLHHGLANGIALPHVMRYNLPNAVESYADFAIVLGVTNRLASMQTRADSFVSTVTSLLERLNVPPTVVNVLGLADENSISAAVRGDILRHIMEDPCVLSNARKVEPTEELRDLVGQVLG